MLPRKRQRPNPDAASSPATLPTASLSQQVSTSLSASASNLKVDDQLTPDLPDTPDNASVASGTGTPKKVREPGNRYGSLPRIPKATASTSIATETASGGTVRSKKAIDLTKFGPKRASDAASIRSTTTASSSSKVPEGNGEMGKAIGNDDSGTKAGDSSHNTAPDAKASLEDTEMKDSNEDHNPADKPTTDTTNRASWLSWVSRTPFTETQITTPAQDDSEPPKRTEVDGTTETIQVAPTDTSASEQLQEPQQTSSSWLPSWGKLTKTLGGSAHVAETPKETHTKGQSDSTTLKEENQPPSKEPNSAPQPSPSPNPRAGSTWAFWSKDSPQKRKDADKLPEAGQIAVMGEGSESHPQAMPEDKVSEPTNKDGAEERDIPFNPKSLWRKSKRVRPQSTGSESSLPLPGADTPPATDQTPETPQVHKSISKSENVRTSKETDVAVKTPPNLLLPSFTSTYQMKENPSILKQLAHILLRTSQPPANHVFRVQEPPKIKKAIAIGIHGLFPAAYLRPMIGQPTGTSLRFAGLCADAIRKWADAHGCPDCEIEKVALEGEGKISDRVDNLWKLMFNWIEHIRSADLIIFASHSQGVPVSVMLLQKLIDLNVITNARIGVCAMAGVALGPFPEYKSSILTGSAAELWEFGDPQSHNSRHFEKALARVLEYGARMTFVGSIDDQLVPMESAVYSPATHPYIYRAVFVDGRIHAPDFITHLVGFALKLRNLGVSDHGLIRELSVPLAGSLYSGEGHSRIYYDPAVYDLAISNTLETTTTSASPVHVQMGKREGGVVSGSANSNPYVLPWIMRGILEEDFVKTELSSETERLLQMFDEWKPANKALKDVKYRLEAVRSRL